MYFIYAFMIVLMYFLAGINKARNFSGTVSGFKNMFLPQFKLPYAISLLAVGVFRITLSKFIFRTSELFKGLDM